MGYVDFNFQLEHDDSKSVPSYIFTLYDEMICWKSSKQHTVADTMCEVEYIAAADATKKVFWVRKFISELGVVPSINGLVLLYCDSTRAIAQAKEPKSHQRTKYILYWYHLVYEIVDRGDVELLKMMKKKIWLTLSLKLSGPKSSMITSEKRY